MDKITWPVSPATHGIDLGDEVWLSPSQPGHDGETVTFHAHRIYRSGVEIGGVDYQVCHACRAVLLGELALADEEQRHGLGTRVLDRLRRDLPGYRWAITPEKPAARPFWDRIRATHPGEYGLGVRSFECAHLLF
ncbi:hypothetical protein [Amycolatopsis thailandensis]|uniref:hypothetical protein n=1 Tax=Amycolatopsis thailandensis TaxID=589330 RepID=UPI00363BE566